MITFGLRYFICGCMTAATERRNYQIRNLLSSGKYIRSPTVTPNASWNSGMFISGPFTRSRWGA